jgi:uncharacterized protein
MSIFALDNYSTVALCYLAAAAVVAGISRGFSGFGGALIFIPLASAVVGPRLSAPLLLVIDTIGTIGLIPRAWRMSHKRDVGLMAIGGFVGVPVGAFMLTRTDPTTIRWIIVVLVIGLLALLMSGWRYRGRPVALLTVGVGGLAGFFSGVAQVGGPPVVAYWLGQTVPAETVRANILLYFAISTVFAVASYLLGGLLTTAIVGLAIVTGPLYGLGIAIGSRMFGLASDATFRGVSYILIAIAAVISLPVLDGLVR